MYFVFLLVNWVNRVVGGVHVIWLSMDHSKCSRVSRGKFGSAIILYMII